MNRWCLIFLCFLFAGCDALTDSADGSELTCDCTSLSERLTPTVSCEASEAVGLGWWSKTSFFGRKRWEGG